MQSQSDRASYLAALSAAEKQHDDQHVETMLKLELQAVRNLPSETDPAIIGMRIEEWKMKGKGRLDKIKDYIVHELKTATGDDAIRNMLRAICELSTDGRVLYSITNTLGIGSSSIEKGRLAKVAAELNRRLETSPTFVVTDDVKDKLNSREELKAIIATHYNYIWSAVYGKNVTSQTAVVTIKRFIANHHQNRTLDLSTLDFAPLYRDDLIEIMQLIPPTVQTLALGKTRNFATDCSEILISIPTTVKHLTMFVGRDVENKELTVLTYAILSGNSQVKNLLAIKNLNQDSAEDELRETLKHDYKRSLASNEQLSKSIKRWTALGFLPDVKDLVVEELKGIEEPNKRYLAMLEALFNCSPQGQILYARALLTDTNITNGRLSQVAIEANKLAEMADNNSVIDRDVQREREKGRFCDKEIVELINYYFEYLSKNLARKKKSAVFRYQPRELMIPAIISSFTECESLDLSHNAFGTYSIEELVAILRAIPSSVTTLNLSNNGLGTTLKAEAFYTRLVNAIPPSVSTLVIHSSDNLFYAASFKNLNSHVKTVTVAGHNVNAFLQMISSFPDTVEQVSFNNSMNDNNPFLAATLSDNHDDYIKKLMASRFYKNKVATNLSSALLSLANDMTGNRNGNNGVLIKKLLPYDLDCAIESGTVESKITSWKQLTIFSRIKDVVVQKLNEGADDSKKINAMVRSLCRGTPYGQILFTPVDALCSSSINKEGRLRVVLEKLVALVTTNADTVLEQSTVDCLNADNDELMSTLKAGHAATYGWLKRAKDRHYPLTSTPATIHHWRAPTTNPEVPMLSNDVEMMSYFQSI